MKNLILIGMMGAGKTTVGNLLGEALALPFVDCDDVTEAILGTSIREAVEDHGEPFFRDAETRALKEIAGYVDRHVVATGAGAVRVPENRALLKSGFVVWLQADPKELFARVGHDSSRPMLADDPLGSLERLSGEREPFYLELAEIKVDTEGKTPENVRDEILARIPK